MILLAIAFAAAPPLDATDSADFKRCLEAHVHSIDDFMRGDGVEICLRESGARKAARGEVDGPPADPLAKEVADDEAHKYQMVSMADVSDPIARCVQASLTAQAYLNAKMQYKYGSWKNIEDHDCKVAGVR